MTIYSYPPTPSVANVSYAFISDSPDPDTLIVGFSAFLISTGSPVAAVALLNQGAWTVRIDGLISSTNGGLVLVSGNAGISSFRIGATGWVSGGISGMEIGSGATIKNAGVIEGIGALSNGIQFGGAATHTVVNTGIISNNGGSISLGWAGIKSDGTSRDVIINGGTISSLWLGGGDDSVTNFQKVGHKIVYGQIGATLLGVGNDVFKGGKFGEDVTDGDGADRISLGSGNDTGRQDTFNDGFDKLDGGKGVDSYSAGAITSDLRINIDSIKHSVSIFAYAQVGANTATGTSPTDQKDTILHFENASGGLGNDLIYGTNRANKIEGSDGNDNLCGFGGNDTLDGGAGIDHLFGGLGKDILTGGSEGDRFDYLSIKESGVTASTRDVITDFGIGDMIDLFQIDAISTNAKGTNDEFNYIGANVDFSGMAGELRAVWTADGQIIEADVNGDKRADFSIELNGHGDVSGFIFM